MFSMTLLPGLMLLSSPLQCLTCAIGGALMESGDVARGLEAGRFPAAVWGVLAANTLLATAVNLVNFVFVKVGHVACRCSPHLSPHSLQNFTLLRCLYVLLCIAPLSYYRCSLAECTVLS